MSDDVVTCVDRAAVTAVTVTGLTRREAPNVATAVEADPTDDLELYVDADPTASWL